MSAEMIFEHMDGRPIGSQMPLYQSILDDIKKATAHLKPLDRSSSDLEGVDLENYELCLDLGMPYFILFPKDPDTHKVLSRMPSSSKLLFHPLLEKLSITFTCFSLDYGDGNDEHGTEYDSDYGRHYSDYDRSPDERWSSDEDWNPDYTACSSSDCGMCGKCDY